MNRSHVILFLLAAASVCGAADHKRDQLVYQYPAPDGSKQIWLCPPRPDSNPVPREGAPWDGCAVYDKVHDFFRAGEVVQLWVVSYPLLSRFKVEIQNEQVFTPNLAYIRGASDAAPATDAGKDKAQSGKSFALAGVPAGDQKEIDALVALINVALPGIEKGDAAELAKALDALRKLQRKADEGLGALAASVQSAVPILDLTIGPGQANYPGPSLQAIEQFAANLSNRWDGIKTDTCIKESLFQASVSDTDLLVRAVKDFNARVASLPNRDAFKKGGTDLVSVAKLYQPIAISGRDVLSRAVKGFGDTAKAAIGIVNDRGKSRVPSMDDAKPAAGAGGDDVLAKFDSLFHSAPEITRTALAGDVPALIREAAQSTADASMWVYRGANWLKAMNVLDLGPAEVNESMAEIFAKANQVYRAARACDDIVIPVKQWTGSVAADLAITEVPGFELYSLGSAVIKTAAAKPAPGGGGDNSGPKPDQPPKTPVKLPDGNDGQQNGNWSDGDTQAADDPKPDTQKPATGAGSKDNTGDTPDKPAADKPSQPKEVISVKVHRFARANFISGFAHSWLKTREYGIGQVGKVGPDGKPLLDANGGQLSIRSAVETRNQPHQYVYYVGLNFYLKQRDLYPGATRVGYWIPGLMFAYGVNDDLNFLTGLNWETKWGLNFGGGVHFGRVTGLGNFGGIPGTVALPDSVTTVPTVQRFSAAPFISIGFDASVFSKVFGAAKGVKGAN